jgi:hypothetical protein
LPTLCQWDGQKKSYYAANNAISQAISRLCVLCHSP